MDPLTFFPPEIVHQIWLHLKPSDLLAARAVAPHWLASISDCPAAWLTDFSHDWTEFLAVKKAVRSWSSNARRQTIRKVRDCLFTEFAYYLLFGDGTLEMFSPYGSAIRRFHRPVTTLHRGDGRLLIVVNGPVRTIVTDFVFNIVEVLDVEIVVSSPRGYSYLENGKCFLSVGPKIPGDMKIPCAPDVQPHFLKSCAVAVDGFTVKTVQLFDTQSCTNLKTCASSPRWIPSVAILTGPDDYFSIIVEQRDFNTVSAYHKDSPLFENSYSSSLQCLFTDNYFVLSLQHTATAFNLADFTKHHQLDLPTHFNIKPILCESSSVVKNTLAIFTLNRKFLVYRLVSSEGPKLQLLTPPGKSFTGANISEFEIFPGYAFKVQKNSCGNERVVCILDFEL